MESFPRILRSQLGLLPPGRDDPAIQIYTFGSFQESFSKNREVNFCMVLSKNQGTPTTMVSLMVSPSGDFPAVGCLIPVDEPPIHHEVP